jgi:hypothetical protein
MRNWLLVNYVKRKKKKKSPKLRKLQNRFIKANHR